MSSVRRPLPVRALLAAVIACCLVLGGCSDAQDSSGSRPGATTAPSEATDSGTPLEEVDTAALVVPRAPFCDRVDPAAVTRALGEQAADASAYRSGQRIKISDDLADVVHEFGCRWTAGDVTAAAWVYAPPITRERAVSLSTLAGGPRCLDGFDRAGFGRPGAACARRSGRGLTVSLHGLFGDAWLSCSLTLRGRARAEAQVRADRWCAAVATAAAAS